MYGQQLQVATNEYLQWKYVFLHETPIPNNETSPVRLPRHGMVLSILFQLGKYIMEPYWKCVSFVTTPFSILRLVFFARASKLAFSSAREVFFFRACIILVPLVVETISTHGRETVFPFLLELMFA
jgi:hypothetical protein